jgi:hypothetical protein
MFSSEKLPGSVMPLWVFLAILIPLLAFTFYLKHQNLTRRFLLLLYCPTSPDTSTASPYHSILSSILVSRPYHPPYYHILGFEYHGQLQTSLQFVLRRLGYLYKGLCNLPRVEYERELLTLSDNGLVALDWGYLKKSQQKIFNNNSSTLIIFQHGLGGNSKSGELFLSSPPPPTSPSFSSQSTLSISRKDASTHPFKSSLLSLVVVVDFPFKLPPSSQGKRAISVRSLLISARLTFM